MTANELADSMERLIELTTVSKVRDCDFSAIATMLRQQQAEIEALKMDIYSLTYGERLAKHLNKPVAWIKQNPETLQAELHFDKPAKYWATVISNPDIPLYTHPMRKLTDEEINEEIEITFGKIIDPEALQDEIDLARRILKKASRK